MRPVVSDVNTNTAGLPIAFSLAYNPNLIKGLGQQQ